MSRQSIVECIKQYNRVIIHRHMRPDPDALGSQVGLQKILQEQFPEKTVRVTGYDEPTLSWLARMDVVNDEAYEGALVIVTDTANTARIDDDRYQKAACVVKIDHHPNDEPYGDLYWVDTQASSSSEMIASLAFSSNWQVPAEAARLLYAGIVGDTGRFLYPATSAKTFAIAARLREYAVDFSALSREMDTVPYAVALLTAYVYEHLEIDENGAARVVLSQDVLNRYHLSDAETAAVVGIPGRIDIVKSWAIFVEQTDGHYRVRLRSKYAPINAIAKRHDGGGHPLASGANSYSLEENEAIFQEIKQVAQHGSC